MKINDKINDITNLNMQIVKKNKNKNIFEIITLVFVSLYIIIILSVGIYKKNVKLIINKWWKILILVIIICMSIISIILFVVE